jgi:hypothetical protein
MAKQRPEADAGECAHEKVAVFKGPLKQVKADQHEERGAEGNLARDCRRDGMLGSNSHANL